MRTRFILNPSSGRNRRRPWLAKTIEKHILREGWDADLKVTEAPAHATALAREAVCLGAERVVAVGGDGTLNEVAQALVHTKTALGLVPCGSGNGLALHLGLPVDFEEALRFCGGTQGAALPIDTGEANGHCFFNVMGLGLDAEVSERFNKLVKRGLPAYATTAWRALRELRPERVSFQVRDSHDTQTELDIALLSIANSDQYGNHARVAPGASVTDGCMNLVAVRPVGWWDAAVMAARLFCGTLTRSAHVLTVVGEEFLIRRAAAGLIHTDGEVHETSALVEVRTRPKSLLIWQRPG